jgi:hypothetical protein
MNRFGSRAKLGALEHNFIKNALQNRSSRRFRESSDGQTKAAP